MSKQKNTNKTLLAQLYQRFRNGLIIGQTKELKEYVDSIGLDPQALGMGYNSAQFHHKKSEDEKKLYIDLGALKPSKAGANAPDRKTYTVVGREGLVLPLKDVRGEIVNYCAYRFRLVKPVIEHLNENGLYPSYPNEETTTLYLCQNEIETATFIQANILGQQEAVLSLRNGELTDVLVTAMNGLTQLGKVIVIGDTSASFKEQFKEIELGLFPNVVSLPDNSTLNEMWVNYNADAIVQCIQDSLIPVVSEYNELIKESDDFYIYSGEQLVYELNGLIPANPTFLEMNVTMYSYFEEDGYCLDVMIDLFDSKGVGAVIFDWTADKDLDYSTIIRELEYIRAELGKYRPNLTEEEVEDLIKGFSTKTDAKVKEILSSKDMFDLIDELIEKAGVVGEKQTRLLLFLIASSYKFKYNLHAVVQSYNVANGSEFITKIAELLPELEQYQIDITTSRTFRYYGNSIIDNKLIVIPDYSGITESKAIKDLKRLQAKGTIVNDVPKKGASGLLTTIKQVVHGHTSSIGACSKSKRYFEGQPKTILVGMDTSPQQEQKLMEYDWKQRAGLIDEKAQQEARETLQYIINNIHTQEVVNPFSGSLMLPIEIPNARMLSIQLMDFVSIITLFKQNQRQLDDQGRVITEKEDIETAIQLFMGAIMVNIDELDATTRDFFDKLKALYLTQTSGEKTKMSSFEIRQEMSMSKSNVNRFLQTLVEFEYLKKDGHKNTGYVYKITNWNDLKDIQQMILDKLNTNQ